MHVLILSILMHEAELKSIAELILRTLVKSDMLIERMTTFNFFNKL